MVAVDVGPFQVAPGEIAMQVQELQEIVAEPFVPPRRRCIQYPEQPDQSDAAKRHIHGACPIDAAGQRVGAVPFGDDAAHGFGVAFVASQQIGLSGRDQPLQAR